MRTRLLPHTSWGKWSGVLMLAMPILLWLGSFMFVRRYANMQAADSILEDLMIRPGLAAPALLGLLSGVAAWMAGLVAVIKKRERAIATYMVVVLGFLLVMFLLGEVLSPH